MKTITELENRVLMAIERTDHSSDGHGLCGYLDQNDFIGLDMKQVRGAMSSLVQKSIIGHEKLESGFDVASWFWIEPEFQTVSDNSNGYEVTNVVVK